MEKRQRESVLVALRRVMRATELHSRDLARTTGLTTPQLLLLQSIKSLGEVSIGELAAEMKLSQATVSSILDRLEARGLVTRRRSLQDKRKIHACLTASGKEIIRRAPPLLQDSFIRQFKALEEWEKSMIIAALQRLAAMMDAGDIDAAPVLDAGTLDRQAVLQDDGKEI